VVLKWHQVATLVAIRVLSSVHVLIVEWLVHVTNIVDQQTQSVGLGKKLITWVKSVLNVVVDVATLVVVTIVTHRQPLDQVGAAVGHVVVVLIVVVGAFIIGWLVDLVLEVEVGLPRATVVFDIVSKGGTLNEWVVYLSVGQLWVVSMQVAQHLDSLIE